MNINKNTCELRITHHIINLIKNSIINKITNHHYHKKKAPKASHDVIGARWREHIKVRSRRAQKPNVPERFINEFIIYETSF